MQVVNDCTVPLVASRHQQTVYSMLQHIRNTTPAVDATELGDSRDACLHDVGGNDSLVVLAACDLTQVEQVPNDSNQEAVLLLLLQDKSSTMHQNIHNCELLVAPPLDYCSPSAN